MQQLHLVGLTTDLDGLIFSTRRNARSGSFVVALDDELLATIADVLRKREGDNPRHAATAHLIAQAAGLERRPQSALSLREIQARLRAGRTVEEVAAEAGVDPDWVERFAVPIRAEQQQVVAQAGRMVYARPRVGVSAQPLAVAVRWNLAERGIRMTPGEMARAWQAWQVHDSVWMVRLTYRSRGRPQVAEWELDVRAGTLAARNRLASQLAYVEPKRRPPVLDDLDEDAVAGAAGLTSASPVRPAATGPARTVAGQAGAGSRPRASARGGRAARPAAKKAQKTAQQKTQKTQKTQKKAQKTQKTQKKTAPGTVKATAKPASKVTATRRASKPPRPATPRSAGQASATPARSQKAAGAAGATAASRRAGVAGSSGRAAVRSGARSPRPTSEASRVAARRAEAASGRSKVEGAVRTRPSPGRSGAVAARAVALGRLGPDRSGVGPNGKAGAPEPAVPPDGGRRGTSPQVPSPSAQDAPARRPRPLRAR